MHVGDIESVYDSRTDGPAAGVDGLRLPSVSTVTAPRGRVKARGGRDIRSHVALMTLTAAPSQTPGRHDRGQRGENSGAGRAEREKGRLTDGVRSIALKTEKRKAVDGCVRSCILGKFLEV